MRTVEEAICVQCRGTFRKSAGENKRGRLPKGVRRKDAIACSKECSKELHLRTTSSKRIILSAKSNKTKGDKE